MKKKNTEIRTRQDSNPRPLDIESTTVPLHQRRKLEFWNCLGYINMFTNCFSHNKTSYFMLDSQHRDNDFVNRSATEN